MYYQQGEVSPCICAVLWAADGAWLVLPPSAVEGSTCRAMPQPRWCMKPLAVVIDFTTSLAGLSEAFCRARKQPAVKL